MSKLPAGDFAFPNRATVSPQKVPSTSSPGAATTFEFRSLTMNIQTFRWCTVIKLAAIAVSLVGISWAGSNERVLYSFTGGADGGDPATPLTRDGQGNLYGTTVLGGVFNCGTVFQLTSAGQGQWQESVLHSFNCLDEGKYPYGGVTLDAQ